MGRTDEAVYISAQIKNPILLPRKHYFTELVITDAHEKIISYVSVYHSKSCEE